MNHVRVDRRVLVRIVLFIQKKLRNVARWKKAIHVRVDRRVLVGIALFIQKKQPNVARWRKVNHVRVDRRVPVRIALIIQKKPQPLNCLILTSKVFFLLLLI